MQDSKEEAIRGDKAARDLMLSELLQMCSKAPWRIDVDIGKTIFDANSNSLMDDAGYYPSVPYNDNDWTLIAIAPTIAAELIKERAVNAKLLEALKDAFCELAKLGYSNPRAAANLMKLIKQAEEL